MFVAREKELALLQTRYDSGRFELVVIYGRRRVGKTRLIREFVSNKSDVYFFTARQTSAKENLASLSAAVLAPYTKEAALDIGLDAPCFSTFEAAFARVFANARDRRTVLVVDEYPYLAKSYPGVSSLLQTLVDAQRESSQLMIILCGSSMSFMEHQVLGEKSPLYGRRTAQLKVEPFDFFDAQRLLGVKDMQRAVELYALVGGIPLYLEELDASLSPEENIAERLLGLGCYLYAEPQNYLLQEVQSPAVYQAIVEAIAHGRTRPAEIADATGISSSNVSEYLAKLCELSLVRRITPVGVAHKKQVLYRMADNLFGFWYAFVPRYLGAIEAGQARAVASRIVSRELSTYVGHVFEEVCHQWLVRQLCQGRFDMLLAKAGCWWGTDPALREQVDVDVVALGADGEVVAGECKWKNEPIGADVIETLAYRANLVRSEATRVELVTFSKSGFTTGAIHEAHRRGNVTLVTLDEMTL